MHAPAVSALILLQSTGGSGLIAFLPMLFIVAIFYFIVFLPQQRRQKKWSAMLEQVKNGDRVTTAGGLRGIVISVKDDAFHLRVPPDNLRLEVVKSSVVAVGVEEK